ncbi:MAG TPA: GTPase HflX [Acidimicrobiia bacterium]|nr:GTPase HflX [Acidimicrobiia bacterium]
MTSDRQARQRRRLTATVTDLEVAVQRAFLVGVLMPGMVTEAEERSLDELALLTDTAGADPVDRELVKRDRLDPATFIGSGKAAELASLTTALDIDVVIFDQALTPAQQRNLQKIFHCDVVDREALILDIFAQHATSKVGAIQVELALLRYNLPRLRGKGVEMAQQRAGVGTTMRGPGETKLETDRRRVLARISKLERQLKETAGHLETQRKQRRRTQTPQVSIVGYTNAGKSTLLNALTEADTLVENQLFATLDPTVRRLDLPDGRRAVLADTVGFVRRLPHHLIEAFRSTLSEASESDLLVHVVDGSDPDPAGQIEAVGEVLEEIGAGSIPQLLVINKIDTLEPNEVERLHNLWPDAVFISARQEIGLDMLLEEVAAALTRELVTLSLSVPYERGDIVAAAHRLGEVIEEKHDDEGTIIDVRVPQRVADRFAGFVSG